MDISLIWFKGVVYEKYSFYVAAFLGCQRQASFTVNCLIYRKHKPFLMGISIFVILSTLEDHP